LSINLSNIVKNIITIFNYMIVVFEILLFFLGFGFLICLFSRMCKEEIPLEDDDEDSCFC